ncbi:defective chorion-1 protein, FC177 isoform-like [Lucilia cuprina]|uniref:defective chorion-1 protein, FC177 isoform-like n=1 Tax=Lucilia cuprina TaxID=7375 RepID=UPI001F064E34|nr:defective chorion-1 protein, FC177 isoform-like [Lucilia cuprina]
MSICLTPLVASPFDGQTSSATNNVLLVLNNDKNKLAELTKPAEDSLKRLTRNPDVMDDIVGQFQQMGGGMTQQILQQVSQTAPEMSRSFGQALNEALSQTNILAQAAPGNLDLSQLTQNFPDFGQLGQSLSQSFILGAAQNLLNPAGAAQAATDDAAAAAADAGAEADPEVGAAAEPEPAPEPEPEPAAEAEAPAAPEAPKNPFEQIVGSALPQLSQLSQLSQLPQLSQFPALPQLPLGLLGPLSGLSPLMPLGSEISEVRVMPDQYSPYKLSPKPVDHQTMAEMKLKAVLRDALNKKTIPILWFHLPVNHHLQKSTEDLEMEAKLEIFEKQVIAELKQLQELSKLANEVKKAQLQSGVEPTESLTTKLNLYEIPIYEITLGDIEKTLKDEHVIVLMHTIVQNQNKQFHRHHQATTKYLTDLTGTPIKRQTKTAEDALKSMEKDDMMKMMTYAYRMAAMHGHEMPWLKNEKITTMNSQQKQATEGIAPMTAERQWLEDKQRQMAEERKQKVAQNQARQWAEPTIQQFPQQQPIERQWANPNIMQPQITMQRQMLPPQMPLQRQMLPPQMQQPMPIQNQMFDPNMQWQQQDLQRQMMPQPMMTNFEMPPQMTMQRQWANPTNIQQQQPIMQTQFTDPSVQPIQRQWADANIPETKGAIKTEQQPEQRQAAEIKTPEQQTSSDAKKTEQQPEQRQWIDTKTTEQTATKTNANMPRNNERMDNMPVVGEAKPQMAENAGKARHKGMEDLFDELDVFDHGKHKGKEAGKSAAPPTVINYYYNTGGSRYPPIYAPGPPPPAAAPTNYGGGYARPPPPPPSPVAQSYGPAGGYAAPPPPPPKYAVAPQYKPAAGPYGGGAYGSNAYGSYGGYRSATGDEEIAVMLQQNQPMPKMMMPLDDATLTATPTVTENHKNNAENLNEENHFKRLAKTQTQTNPGPAAYIIVIKNNTNKSGSKTRRKRSTDYATLEPIDENSLEALRKTYKNSLKEITLNPNETPAEALMRYNAESIREALQKANKQPMEIAAGGEHEDVKQGQITQEVEQQPLHQQLPQSYALNNNNEQYMPLTGTTPSQMSNFPYITYPMSVPQTQPLSASYNPPLTAYDHQSSVNQGGFYNNYISKYNTSPALYSNNNNINMPVTPNPFLSMYNSLESVPFIEDYSMTNQPYQDTNHNMINDKSAKSVVYQNSYTQPQLAYNQLSTSGSRSSNIMNKNFQHYYTNGDQHLTDYGKTKTSLNGKYSNEVPSSKTQYPFSNKLNKNVHISSYNPVKQAQLELTNHYKAIKSQETSSFDNLIAVIKERLTQCCNECKENILKGIDETLKRKHYGNNDKLKILEINVKPYGDKPHTVSYRKPSKEEDFEYQQWLREMSQKGYDKSYLTKQHQRDYLKDGKVNLHIAEEEGYEGPEEEKGFYKKNNQSYKRETTVPEIEVETKTEAELTATTIKSENNIEKLEEEEDEEEEEEVEEEEVDELETETESVPQPEEVEKVVNEEEKQTPTETKIEKSHKNTKKETDIKKDSPEKKTKESVKKENLQNLNTTKSMETAESTTHSVYALRGQFRPQKSYPKPFVLKQGKQFANYRNVNKLGSSNSITKTIPNGNTVDKNDKLEEILDILHDLSKHTKEKIKVSSKEEISKATRRLVNTTKVISTTTPTSVSSTSKPLAIPSTALANDITKEKPRKLSRRRVRLFPKTRKLVRSSTSRPNLNVESRI